MALRQYVLQRVPQPEVIRAILLAEFLYLLHGLRSLTIENSCSVRRWSCPCDSASTERATVSQNTAGIAIMACSCRSFKSFRLTHVHTLQTQPGNLSVARDGLEQHAVPSGSAPLCHWSVATWASGAARCVRGQVWNGPRAARCA